VYTRRIAEAIRDRVGPGALDGEELESPGHVGGALQRVAGAERHLVELGVLLQVKRDGIISQQLPLAEYDRAFELLRNGDATKIILEIGRGA
jgi:hypothetical protein